MASPDAAASAGVVAGAGLWAGALAGRGASSVAPWTTMPGSTVGCWAKAGEDKRDRSATPLPNPCNARDGNQDFNDFPASFPRRRESTTRCRSGLDSCIDPRLRGDDVADNERMAPLQQLERS